MSLRIYNTLRKKKEEFSPLNDNQVKMYVCGVTLYDELHLGHARAAVIFDVIYRYLKHQGWQVKYVTNFTDVDDKMIDRAQMLNLSIYQLAERLMGEYSQQMHALGVLPALCYPRATQHLPEIIDLIKRLERKGLAYVSEGDVFFRVKKFPDYGKLSGQTLSELSAGARIEINEKKEDPLDFALWKKSKKGEPTWDSPWGKGRPGWHIECSAMAMKYLGETIDIHGGGQDLVFPHHENEIAQSEGATGKTFARFWIHNGLVTMSQAKMSKSTGNFLTLREALKNYPGEIIRFFLLSAHYRSPLDYSQTSLKEASLALKRIHTLLDKINNLPKPREDSPIQGEGQISQFDREIESSFDNFIQALNDDFNTPLAISAIFQLVKKANLFMEKVDLLNLASYNSLIKVRDRIRQMGQMLGLFQVKQQKESPSLESINELHQELAGIFKGKKPGGYFSTQIDQMKSLPPKQVIDLWVDYRNKLRRERNWALADEIRSKLANLGIILEDGKKGTTWRWSMRSRSDQEVADI